MSQTKSELRLETVNCIKPNQENCTGIIFFDPADKIYTDHFPSNPIVPGSLIVNAFMTAAQNAGLVETLCYVEDFRFKQFVSPGEYPYRIEQMKDGLRCKLYNGNKLVASGKLKYET